MAESRLLPESFEDIAVVLAVVIAQDGLQSLGSFLQQS
jgi:hypothetical protein